MAEVLADPTSAANLVVLRPSTTPLCVVASLPGAAACATARRLRDFVVRALRNSTLKVRSGLMFFFGDFSVHLLQSDARNHCVSFL